MQFKKPKFWDKKNSFISFLLLPLSILMLFIILLKKKFSKKLDSNIPVICIGNIYIGGTGKTPTTIFLAKELSQIGKKPAILRKHYESHSDEYNLIRNEFNSLFLNSNRAKGISEVESKGFDSVILDDGFQDYKIKKNLSIICFNNNQLIGNGFVLPAGPLREDLSSLKNANIILINGKKSFEFEEKLLNVNKYLKIFYSKYEPKNLSLFKNKKLLAISGIGNPENFFKLLNENNLDIKEKLIFPDHYRFDESEIRRISNNAKRKNYHIIMTEKDYYKVKDFKLSNIEYLKVDLEIFDKENFLKIVKEVYDKKI